MQVSKRKLNGVLEKQLFSTFYQLVLDLKNKEEAETVFGDLFSQTELLSVIKRLSVAYWLSKNRSYENIKNNLNVSSATIADVQTGIKSKGWKLMLEKLSADEWATVWEQKIKGAFKIPHP